MGEEQILGGNEKQEKRPEVNENIDQKESIDRSGDLENLETGVESEIKQAQEKIKTNSFVVQQQKDDIAKDIKNVANLETAEDQIQKLTEIASQSGPQKALKVAKALNSNYALDEMHDRLIDEENLRKILMEKGFIERI